MTPHQLNLCILDYNAKKKADDEEKIILVYMGAYWNRIKRMPSLKQILNKNKPQKRMTPEEILAQVKELNKALGGTTY